MDGRARIERTEGSSSDLRNVTIADLLQLEREGKLQRIFPVRILDSMTGTRVEHWNIPTQITLEEAEKHADEEGFGHVLVVRVAGGEELRLVSKENWLYTRQMLDEIQPN